METTFNSLKETIIKNIKEKEDINSLIKYLTFELEWLNYNKDVLK